MPNTTCLFGPAFSLTGDLYFIGTDVNFQVTFDNEADRAGILAYEWFLDNTLLIEQNNLGFVGKVDCGPHTIGVRILSTDGWSGIKSLEFGTCKVPTSLIIYGADVIDEGNSTNYYVLQLYSDGSTIDFTAQYTFTSTSGGSFTGNTFTADLDDTSYDTFQVTISAVKDGVEPITKQVTVNNTTPIIVVSLLIIGPDTIDEGTSASYTVIVTYSNGSQQDLTAEYVFTSTVGSFTGNILTVPLNSISGDDRPATIYASKDGSGHLSKQITIMDVAVKAGILVVDLYNDSFLDVIGLVDNAEVVGNHVAAYTGNNIVPSSAIPSDALVLASDLNAPALTNWRFEFNIAKLVIDYPGTSDFVFYIKGRSTVAGTLNGSFSVRSNDALMTMSNNEGVNMPSVSGGSTIVPITDFSSAVVAGANGSYAESDLTSIIIFNYNVPADLVTYTIKDKPIEVNDFDFMAVRYHWKEGAGADLDILVGYENNGTPSDGVYVGFGQPNPTVPENTVPQADAYLWWAADQTTSEGYECVLVGIKKFIAAFPVSPDIVEIGLYAVWFGLPESGNFDVELVTYKGGTMSIQGTDFINTGGVQVSSNTIPVNTLIRNNTTLHIPETSYKVGTLRYNKTTQSAIIVIN